MNSPRTRKPTGFFILLLGAVAFALGNPSAQAAENGTGFYLLGSKGPMAGVIPAPGVYFQNDIYYYNARTDKSGQLPTGGKVAVGLKANAVINLPTVIWSTPHKFLDGRLAFSLTVPFGYQRIEADLIAGDFEADTSNHISTVGDPVFNTILAWDKGPYHWNITGMLNIPVGHYREGSMANIAFHRWGGDISISGTWYDPEMGWDISGVTGFTFNGRNPKTDYRTGTEWHMEAAISRDIGRPGSSVGVMGYHYQQISGDSGDGAILGGFRGRTTALGLTASHSFKIGSKPALIRLKALKEFNTKNRVRGTAAYLTLSLPLFN